MSSSSVLAGAARGAEAGPAVSVIIPAYNVSGYIGDALRSVFAQTYTDYEVIVINDGSHDTDELERVLQSFGERIVYLKQENRGLSGARNTGIRAARGRFIALLDADDVWEPEYLAVQVGLMDSDQSLDVLYPNGVIFGDAPEAGRECMDLSPSEGDVTFEKLVLQKCNVMVFVTARREAVVRAGLFDESLRSSEDFDLWLRILKQGGRIGYHRRVLARYRRRAGSLSSDPVWMCNSALRVLEKIERTMDLTPSERAALIEQRTRFQASLRMQEGKRAFFQGDTRKAIADMAEANLFFASRKTSLILFLLRLAPNFLLRLYNIRDRFVLRTSTKF